MISFSKTPGSVSTSISHSLSPGTMKSSSGSAPSSSARPIVPAAGICPVDVFGVDGDPDRVFGDEVGVFDASGAMLADADRRSGLFGAGVGVIGQLLRGGEEDLRAVGAGGLEGGGLGAGGVGPPGCRCLEAETWIVQASAGLVHFLAIRFALGPGRVEAQVELAGSRFGEVDVAGGGDRVGAFR